MFESILVHLQKQRIPLCWTSKATWDEATSGIINVFRLMTYPKKGETRCEPWQTFILHCKKWWKKLQQVTFRIAFKIDILLNVMKIESMQCHTNTVYIVWQKITVKAEFWCLWYLDEVSFKLLILLRISNLNRGTGSCLKKKDNANAWELYISIAIINSHAMKNNNNKPSTTSKIYEAKYKFKAKQHRP